MSPAPVDLATCIEAADVNPALAPAPRCYRSSLGALPPFGETPSDTAPLVSLPLAVPFSAKCAFPECLSFGVQSRLLSFRKTAGSPGSVRTPSGDGGSDALQGQLIHEPLPKKWDLLKPLNVKITPESPARSLVSVLTTEHLKISARCMTCEGDFRGIPQNGWKVARCAWGSGFALTVAAGQANCPHLCDLSFSLDVTLTHCSRPSYNRPLTYVTGKRPQVKVVALHDLFLTTILQSVPMLVFLAGKAGSNCSHWRVFSAIAIRRFARY